MFRRNPIKRGTIHKNYLDKWKKNFQKPGIYKKYNEYKNVNKYRLHRIPNNMMISDIVTRNIRPLYNTKPTNAEISQEEIFKQRYSNIYDIHVSQPVPKNLKWSSELPTIHEYDNNDSNLNETIDSNNESINNFEYSSNNTTTNQPRYEVKNYSFDDDNYEMDEFVMSTENLNLNDYKNATNSNRAFLNLNTTIDDQKWENISSSSGCSTMSNYSKKSFERSFNNEPCKISKWTPFCQKDDNFNKQESTEDFVKKFNENINNILTTNKFVESSYFNFNEI